MPDYLWAFEKGLTIRDMADKHCGKDWVVSLDIKDYFPSIKQRHVLSTLEDFGISGWAGKLISEIVTYKAKVPQGALTSPKISNMVTATTFGPQVHDLCELLGIVLTVYADDITMSFDYSEDLFDKVASEYQLWHPSHPVPEARSGKSICMMLIYLIYKKDTCVCQMVKKLELKHNLISHHLKTLQDMGYISSTKNGQHVMYHLEESKKNIVKNLYSVCI